MPIIQSSFVICMLKEKMWHVTGQNNGLSAMRKFIANVKHHINYACIYTDVNIYKFYANIYNIHLYRVRKGTNIFTYIFTPHLQCE